MFVRPKGDVVVVGARWRAAAAAAAAAPDFFAKSTREFAILDDDSERSGPLLQTVNLDD